MFMTPAGSASLSQSVGNSLRFRPTAAPYFYRTPPVAGNQSKWTFSFWVKRTTLGAIQQILAAYTGNLSTYSYIYFDASDKLFWSYTNTATAIQTKRVFRDTSAWYHIVLVMDTANSTAAMRYRVFVNGVEETQFDVDNRASLLNYAGSINGAVANVVGAAYNFTGANADWTMSEVRFIDGQALDASYFGVKDTTTGQWQPKAYTGTYGTTGYYLNFSDGTSAATLCQDKSGNGNHQTANGFSVTPGVTYDWSADTPTNNHTGLNVLFNNYGALPGLITESGQKFVSSTTYHFTPCTVPFPKSGKWYAEFIPQDGAGIIGVADLTNYNASSGNIGGGYGWYGSIVWTGASVVAISGVTAWAANDVIGVAVDMSVPQVQWYKNGVLMATQALSASGDYAFACGDYHSSAAATIYANFGQRAFSYLPSGYSKLCAANMPDSAVVRSERYFKTRTYIGNGGGLQIGEIQKAVDFVLINQSLRFNSADASFLGRTPAAQGSTTTLALSLWHKPAPPNYNKVVLEAGNGTSGNRSNFSFTPTGQPAIYHVITGTNTEWTFIADLKVIDSAKWYHIQFVIDTTNANADDRMRIYVDGNRCTGTYTQYNGTGGGVVVGTGRIPQNQATWFNTTGVLNRFSCLTYSAGSYLDGYLAEVVVVDGQAPLPTSFGQWDANGYWVPKAYTGTHGTNGCYLTFADSSAATATALGKDYSGNTNNWTPSGFSVTAGSTMDVLSDSPTNSYATLNQLDAVLHTISDGGLKLSLNTAANPRAVRATIGVTAGTYYYESTPTAGNSSVSSYGVGSRTSGTDSNGYPTNNSVLYVGDGRVVLSAGGPTVISGLATYTAGDIVGIAFNAATGYVAFYKNAVLVWSGIALSPTEQLFPFMTANNTGNSSTVNFGQRPFAYTPPAGYVALCENNVAEYTDDLEVPDLVWIKSRSAATNHMLFDSTRGAGKYLSSSAPSSNEVTDANSLIQFNKNGFYLGNNADLNTLNASYVAWMWKKGVTPGFDISAPFTGTGSPQTVAHGLGVTPAMILIFSTSGNWINSRVYHKSLAAGNALQLSTAVAPFSEPATFANVGASSFQTTQVAAQGNIAYLFAEVPGFSKFGSYSGNSSADGAFVYLGFAPKFVLIKDLAGASFWFMMDSERESLNPVDVPLSSNTTNGESYTGYLIDYLANGFKHRFASGDPNQAGRTYIYAAFAENPFKYANAR